MNQLPHVVDWTEDRIVAYLKMQPEHYLVTRPSPHLYHIYYTYEKEGYIFTAYVRERDAMFYSVSYDGETTKLDAEGREIPPTETLDECVRVELPMITPAQFDPPGPIETWPFYMNSLVLPQMVQAMDILPVYEYLISQRTQPDQFTLIYKSQIIGGASTFRFLRQTRVRRDGSNQYVYQFITNTAAGQVVRPAMFLTLTEMVFKFFPLATKPAGPEIIHYLLTLPAEGLGGGRIPLPYISARDAATLFQRNAPSPGTLTMPPPDTQIDGTSFTWQQVAEATQLDDLNVSDIHEAIRHMANKPLIDELLGSFPDQPEATVLPRWKNCMYYLVYNYSLRPSTPVNDQENAIMTPQRVWGMVEWLATQRLFRIFGSENTANKRRFSHIVSLLEAVPDGFKPVVAFTILSGILASYETLDPTGKRITLLNWEIADDASCPTGSLDYMIIQCGNAFQRIYGLPAVAPQASLSLQVQARNLFPTIFHEFQNYLYATYRPMDTDTAEEAAKKQMVYGPNEEDRTGFQSLRKVVFRSFWNTNIERFSQALQNELNEMLRRAENQWVMAEHEIQRIPEQQVSTRDAVWVTHPLAPIYRTMYEGKKKRMQRSKRTTKSVKVHRKKLHKWSIHRK